MKQNWWDETKFWQLTTLVFAVGMLFFIIVYDQKVQPANEMDKLIAWNHTPNFSCNLGCYRMGMETIKGFNDSNAGQEHFAHCSDYCLKTFGDVIK